MLYECAMTPDLFDASKIEPNGRGCIILPELLRGLADNGLLSNLNDGGWLEQADKRSLSLPQELRDKVIKCLSILSDRHRIINHPLIITSQGGCLSDCDWLKAANDSSQHSSLHAILLSQHLLDVAASRCNNFVEFFSSLDSPQWACIRKRTLSMEKSENGYRNALKPILKYAKALMLVDKDFCTENNTLQEDKKRFFKTVEICSELMGCNGFKKIRGRIHIHAELRRQRPENLRIEDYMNNWAEQLYPLIEKHELRFKVFLWQSLYKNENMHDRFILTDQCGISAPGGLDCRTATHANSTDWSLLDEDVRRKRWEDYDPSISQFKIRGVMSIEKMYGDTEPIRKYIRKY